MDQLTGETWPSGVSPRALAVFRAVCAAGSQQQVAAQLGVSPSAVSRQLHELEDALQLRLFERIGRRTVLTRAGEEILRAADDLLAAAAALGACAAGLRAGRSGRLRVAGSIAVGSYWLPARLGAFLAERPSARLQLEQGPAYELYEAVRVGRFDLVVAPGADLPAGLERRVLGEASVLLIARRGTCPPEPLDPEWLAAQDYVCAPAGTRGRALFDGLLAGVGLRRRRVVAEVGHPEGVKALVRAGRGVAMTFGWSVADELARGELIGVGAPGRWEVPIQAFTRAGHVASPLLRDLLDALAGGPGSPAEAGSRPGPGDRGLDGNATPGT